MREFRAFLEKNGFDTGIVGCNYFVDLLEEVVNMLLEDRDEEEIKELFPSLCLEYYHFCYEVSRFKFLDELNYFSMNGYRKDDKEELSKWNENVVDKLIRLARRYIEDQKQKEEGKKLVKNNNCKVLNVFQ